MYPMNVSQNVGGQAAHVLRTNERCPGKTGLKSAAGGLRWKYFLCRWHACVIGCLCKPRGDGEEMCEYGETRVAWPEHTHTRDSPAKKERAMDVRNRRLKLASGFFSSARAS